MTIFAEREQMLLGALRTARAGTTVAPRVVVVCAHPDDEVIGAGARLACLRNTRVVYVTDGAPRDGVDARAHGFATAQAYAAARAAERAHALALAGIGPDRVYDLGCADQEVSFAMPALARQLERMLVMLQPDIVLTHAYEGGHPDHDATAFIVHLAARRARTRGAHPPVVIEMTGYHAIGATMRVGAFLPFPCASEVAVMLDSAARHRKRQMLACHATQRQVLAPFPLDAERFRGAPPYDFTQPPHEGALFYEHFGWGMTGDRWRALAAEARRELDPALQDIAC